MKIVNIMGVASYSVGKPQILINDVKKAGSLHEEK